MFDCEIIKTIGLTIIHQLYTNVHDPCFLVKTYNVLVWTQYAYWWYPHEPTESEDTVEYPGRIIFFTCRWGKTMIKPWNWDNTFPKHVFANPDNWSEASVGLEFWVVEMYDLWQGNQSMHSLLRNKYVCEYFWCFMENGREWNHQCAIPKFSLIFWAQIYFLFSTDTTCDP